MTSIKIEIQLYQTAEGRSPCLEWFDSLKDTTLQDRIQARLTRVQTGLRGDHKYISDGISELRLHFGSGYRIYFGELGQTLILLVCGGDKKSQSRDIRKAHFYWNDFKRRTKDETEPAL